jgi:hypothetical protein
MLDGYGYFLSGPSLVNCQSGQYTYNKIHFTNNMTNVQWAVLSLEDLFQTTFVLIVLSMGFFFNGVFGLLPTARACIQFGQLSSAYNKNLLNPELECCTYIRLSCGVRDKIKE